MPQAEQDWFTRNQPWLPTWFMVISVCVLGSLNIVASLYASSPLIDQIHTGSITFAESRSRSSIISIESKLLSSSVIVDLLTIVFIISSVMFILKISHICASYLKSYDIKNNNNSEYRVHSIIKYISIGAIIFSLLYALLSLYVWKNNSGKIFSGTFFLMGHDKPSQLIEEYCRDRNSTTVATAQIDNKPALVRIISLERSADAASPTTTDVKHQCQLTSRFGSWLFVVAAMSGISAVGTILFFSAATLTPLDRFTANVLVENLPVRISRRSKESRQPSADGTYIDKLTIEFRKRTGELQDVFGFGAILLFIAIAWMAARVKWAAPLITEMHGTAALSFFNAYIVLVAVSYSAVLFLSYAPQMFILHRQFREFYYRAEITRNTANAEEMREAIVGFTDWLKENHLADSVLTARDLIPMLVPLVSLLLSGALELTAIRDLAAGMR